MKQGSIGRVFLKSGLLPFYPLIYANPREFGLYSRRLARIGGLVFDFKKAVSIGVLPDYVMNKGRIPRYPSIRFTPKTWEFPGG